MGEDGPDFFSVPRSLPPAALDSPRPRKARLFLAIEGTHKPLFKKAFFRGPTPRVLELGGGATF